MSIRWQAYEHEHVERTVDWYWALGITAGAIAVISILLRDPLFGLLIIVAAITLALVSRHPPILSNIEISERGVRINHIIHRYKDIIAFWVEVEHNDGTALHTPVLLIETRKFTAPNIIIPIDQEVVDPASVRAFLREHAHEVHMHEPLAHKIIEFFGF